MGDGWMDGWMGDGFQKGSRIGDINVRKFGKSAKNFLYRKKIQLQLSKSAGFFGRKKGSLISFKKFSDEAEVI